MADSRQKRILIIAGPNGAGKTTFATEFLPNEADCLEFVNADLIAAGLSPQNPGSVAVKAGRIMLQEIKNHVLQGNSFAFETTLSGRVYRRLINDWRSQGYHVKLIFLSLRTADDAVGRVAIRVAQGGHYIPDDVVRRRFESGLSNFHKFYKNEVDSWRLYDSNIDGTVLIEEGKN